ncbi:MAG TPA: hypothetical protein VKA15_17125, partial [Isosphaeraceae bacterium]|nr:hypothetical protein [Isosphaeraceae bacterium]
MNTSYELLTVCRPRGAIPSSATDFFLGVPNLDLYVYDPYGRKVAYDDGPSDNCSAQFYAGYTAKYTFKVVNRSNFTGNEYL